jgi:hypothetical protein
MMSGGGTNWFDLSESDEFPRMGDFQVWNPNSDGHVLGRQLYDIMHPRGQMVELSP